MRHLRTPLAGWQTRCNAAAMYSAEVLSQLRSLNWLAQEVRRVPSGSLEGLHLQDQIAAVRARLPNSILSYHDRLATRGLPSVASVNGTSCRGCHLKLPSSILGDLALAGRFSVCPNCGVFLWSGDEAKAPEKLPARRIASNVTHA